MDPIKKRRATYQDVLDSPEHMIAEIIGGELRLSSRPGGPATAVASALGDELGPPFKRGRGGPGGWLILDEPELHLGDQIVVPDLAGWRIERMPVVPDGAHFTLPPDWICEVLSRSTERSDRQDKMPIYASHGVQYAWLVHPRRRTLEAFRLCDARWLPSGTYKDTDRARIEPFEAIELDLPALWAHVPLPTRASEPAAEYTYGTSSEYRDLESEI
jgi:Uma2 family endonuclease